MFSIIVVTCNSADILTRTLDSIPLGHEVIVVDNASTDDSVAIARSFGAEVVELERNLGFGAACNRGVELAGKQHLFFLNPDAALDASTLDVLARAFRTYPDAAAFNPRMLEADGKQLFSDANRALPEIGRRRARPPAADQEVTVLWGGALAVRKSVFDALGGFDENIFLYFEDDELCARILLKGHKLYYIHDAVAHLRVGQSTPPGDDVTDLKEYAAMKSKLYLRRKYRIRQWPRLRAGVEFLRAYVLPADHNRKIRSRARLRALREPW